MDLNTSGPIQSLIEEKLVAALDLQHLEVINESGNHNVPAGSESHFKLVLVTSDFEDQRLIKRHQIVNKILKEELADRIHALSMHTFTEAEWKDRHGDIPMSPPCLGGGRKAS